MRRMPVKNIDNDYGVITVFIITLIVCSIAIVYELVNKFWK